MRFIPPPPPAGCVTAEEHERKLVALADQLEAKASDMLTSDVRIGVSAGKELALAAIRARKIAAELAVVREGAERELWITREYQRLRGVSDQRAPLRRKAG